MPIYQYSCLQTGEIVDLILPLSDYNKKEIMCPIHAADFHLGGDKKYWHNAEKIWSIPAYPSHAPSTIIYRNPQTGEVRTAVLRNQETPDGFVKEELKTPFERTKVEHELQTKADIENEIVTERRRFMKDESTKNRHDDAEANMSRFDSQTQNLLKAAMKRSKKKEIPKKKSEFHFAVNHENSSNLNKG